ncbi:MAG: hypothetical protein IKD70_06260 [Eggerthellaceae bacterium]|nr:hypothetical protein [Eggerthellaceae bacterium]
MALITCPECGNRISEFAESCPGCGCPSRMWAKHAVIPASLKAGDRFQLGAWGGEPLSWQVLEAEEGEIFALCENGVDCEPFSENQWRGNLWQTSHLKDWLERVFRVGAFTADEQACIGEVTCLDDGEAKRFLADDASRICEPSPTATRRGAYLSESRGSCCWWLRTPGDEDTDALYVDYFGRINPYGCSITDTGVTVRPALRLKR